MALDMTTEQKELGKANFTEVTDSLTRRGFMKSMVAAAAVTPIAAAAYFGYESIKGKPVKAALIGCGDEGGVLLGEHNPEYLQFVAACDIRPYNKTRILNGDPKVALRKGFAKVYGADYAKNIGDKHFYESWQELLEKEKDIEAVVIALPLHLHAPVAIACMKAGKHVLCEKLMARTIGACKEMIAVADDPKVDRILTIGHQRHYSMLYAHAVEVMNSGVLGDVKHIRALWHRNFSWPWSPDANGPELAVGVQQPQLRDGWYQPVFKMDHDALKDSVTKYGYDNVEQLIRWRLDRKTGGGLMAELGSHQLDASSIFLGKVHPIAVTGVGGRYFFGPGKNQRDIDDHIFLTFEFPGKNYPKDPSDVVIVSYSSISTNGFEAYGECLMGSRGSLVVEGEQSAMLYTEKNPTAKGANLPRSTNVSVSTVAANKPALEASSTWGPAAPTAATAAGPAGAPAAAASISRGYKEEMEDFAYCIRRWNQGMSSDRKMTRCPGRVAMADAIIAFTANLAMTRKQRIEFKEGWFDAESAEVPEKDGELA